MDLPYYSHGHALAISVYCFHFAFVVVKGLLEHLFADRVKTGTAGKSSLYFSRLFSLLPSPLWAILSTKSKSTVRGVKTILFDFFLECLLFQFAFVVLIDEK